MPATVATHLFVPESPLRVPGRVNWPGAALMSLGLVAVLLGVSEAPVWRWLSAKTLGAFAVGIVLLASGWTADASRGTRWSTCG